jgi:AcrR family transcriptional regulator
MGARREFEPRKRPLQARSRATVDAILQAATYILVTEGWQQLTTNRIAERAGVNIASLYQYFSNKEAIIAELEIRHSQQMRALAPRVLPHLLQQRELRAVLRTIVDVVVQEHCVAPALHRCSPRNCRNQRGSPQRMTLPIGTGKRPCDLF